MKISIKKISGLVSVLVLGLFLASCADDGKNQTYKLGKVSVTAKYENGNPVVGKSVKSILVLSDINKITSKANEIAKNKGISDIDNLDWFDKFAKLHATDTIIKDVLLDENGKAEVPILTEYGSIKFSNLRDFMFTSQTLTKIIKNQNISSGSITITLPNE